MKQLLTLALRIFSLIQDPKTGGLSLSRSAGLGLIALGAEQTKTSTTLEEVIAGGVLLLAGSVLVAVRTRTTETK